MADRLELLARVVDCAEFLSHVEEVFEINTFVRMALAIIENLFDTFLFGRATIVESRGQFHDFAVVEFQVLVRVILFEEGFESPFVPSVLREQFEERTMLRDSVLLGLPFVTCWAPDSEWVWVDHRWLFSGTNGVK